MDNSYFIGLFVAFWGKSFIGEPISEEQIEMIKESLSRFCEKEINCTPLSYQEKEEQKCQMKQSLDAYIHGVKDGLKVEGIMIKKVKMGGDWRKMSIFAKKWRIIVT